MSFWNWHLWADEMKQINEYEQVSCPECKGVFHPMTLDIEHALDCKTKRPAK